MLRSPGAPLNQTISRSTFSAYYSTYCKRRQAFVMAPERVVPSSLRDPVAVACILIIRSLYPFSGPRKLLAAGQDLLELKFYYYTWSRFAPILFLRLILDHHDCLLSIAHVWFANQDTISHCSVGAPYEEYTSQSEKGG